MPDQSPKLPADPSTARPPQAQAAERAGGPSNAAEGKGVYKYLPIECPNCGFQGKVNISRLDQTFHCKQCNQVFHVTRDGTVTGERPHEAVAPDPHLARPAEDKPNWLERHFIKLPPAAKWAVLGVVVLLLALGAMSLFEPAEPLPGEMEDRAMLAAKSLAAGDWATLKRLAKHRTSSDLSQWYEMVRPADWEDVNKETPVKTKFEGVTQKLKKYQGTKPIIDKLVRFTIEVKGKKPLQVTLIFTEDKEAQWWLDGEEMLKTYRPPKEQPPEDEE